jgi:DNA topoisomerase III
VRLFIAEKPSLARAIADALPGSVQRRDGYLECSNGDVVAWCAGHILELAPPDAYDPDFKQWRTEHLPITPRDWKLTVTAPDLLKTIKALLPRASVVVNAGDPDREGQLLVDEVLVFLGYRGRVERVLVNDLNVPAVRKSIDRIESNEKFRCLYEAALGRQRADWLYGINMTRLYTVLGRQAGYQGVLSVGRVQTPLLGLIVRRDADIEAFVSTPYYEVVAEIAGAAHPFSASWQPGPGSQDALDSESRVISASLAAEIARRTRGQPGSVTKATRERKSEAPPLPFSLAELQIEAGRRQGMSPKATLDICQALYETHRLVTYPRSDCSYLPEGHLSQVNEVSQAISSVEPSLAPLVAQADRSLRSRAWNDAKVTAHHAIIPTPRGASSGVLSSDERAVYNLIARRYLAQFFPSFEYQQLEAQLVVAGEAFVAKGRAPLVPGWKRVLDVPAAADDGGDDGDEESASVVIPVLAPGQSITATETRTVERKTKPPKRFTSATLLQAMIGIARFVSNPKIKQLLRDTDGIGTPATQAAIIQTLFDRKYIEQKKRQIISTPTGRALIAVLPAGATQPDMTALWEAALRKIQDGQAPLHQFLAAVTSQLRELVTRARVAPPMRLPGAETKPCPSAGCAGSLRMRKGPSGAFWACSRYPECKHTEDPRSAAQKGGKGRKRYRRNPGAVTAPDGKGTP